MAYIIFGVCAVLCIVLVILAFRILKENRKLLPPKKERARYEEEEDIWS